MTWKKIADEEKIATERANGTGNGGKQSSREIEILY